MNFIDVVEKIPPAANHRIAIRVEKNAERALRNGHPWLFDRAIRSVSPGGNPGDLAVIFDQQRKFLAIGLYDPVSPIRVRVLQHRQPQTIDAAFFHERIQAAAGLRTGLPAETTGYRLIHGENDHLPGLVVDRYAQTLVIKLYTLAWIPHLKTILAGLAKTVSFERVILRLSRELSHHPEYLFGLEDGSLIWGEAAAFGLIQFQENGITFEIDPLRGHKTGFYLDQRENRARVEKLAAGKQVLNVFAYTGGFSLYAARGGARQVTSVDISQPALQAAQKNFRLNQQHPKIAACQHQILPLDAFEAFKQLAAQNQVFDLIIIDPPSFAKQKSEIQTALRAYQRLTRLGLQILKPGGYLVQASCSSRISADDFFAAVSKAARSTGRPLRVFERSAHPADHPIRFAEGAYLKCIFAQG